MSALAFTKPYRVVVDGEELSDHDTLHEAQLATKKGQVLAATRNDG